MYRAEWKIRKISNGRAFDSIEDVQQYVDALTASDWWTFDHVRRVEVFALRPTHRSTAGCAVTAHEKSAGAIHIAPSGMNESTVLHEVAHTVCHEGAGHGPKWVQAYQTLVYRVAGPQAYLVLHQAFQDAGVLFD